MSSQKILSILDSWNFWNQEIDTGIPRAYYLNQLQRFHNAPEVLVLNGIRRSGKSTIALQYLKKCIQHGIPPKNTLFINFEESRLGDTLTAKDLAQIYDIYRDKLNPKGRHYLVLDEVQRVKNWERFVAGMYDRKDPLKIVVTGSSATLLEQQLATLLSGRYLSIPVKVLSFSEFHQFTKNSKSQAFTEYCQWGGFPRVALEPDHFNKQKLLNEYYTTILERDVLLRHQIRNREQLRQVAAYTFTNFTQEISTYKLAQTLHIKDQTVSNYLSYLEDAFLVTHSKRFAYSLKKQQYNPDKIYVADNGLRNANAFVNSPDLGKQLVNLIFNHLHTQYPDLYYWKNGHEVDIAVKQGFALTIAINVVYDLQETPTLNREIASLQNIKRSFPNIRLVLVYFQGKPKQVPSDITVMPALDLLSNKIFLT